MPWHKQLTVLLCKSSVSDPVVNGTLAPGWDTIQTPAWSVPTSKALLLLPPSTRASLTRPPCQKSSAGSGTGRIPKGLARVHVTEISGASTDAVTGIVATTDPELMTWISAVKG